MIPTTPSEDLSVLTSAVPSHRSFQGVLYRVLLQHMDSVELSSESFSLVRTLPQLGFLLIQTLQILGMILELTTETLSSTNVSEVMEAFKAVRPDVWAEETEESVAFLTISIGLLMASAVLFLVELVLVYLKPERKLSVYLMACSQSFPILVHRVLFLPLLHFYLSVTRYSMFLLNPETQYIGAWKGILSLLGVGLVFGLVSFRVLFFYESAWYLRTSKLLSRPNSDYECAELVRLTAMCFVFVYMRQYSVVISLALVCAAGGNLFYYLVVTAPYYNPISLNVKRAEMMLVSWMCVCALVGIAVSCFEAALLLFVIITPCTIILEWVQLKNCAWCLHREVLYDFTEFELVLRTELSQGTPNNEERIKALWAYGLVNFHKVKQYYLFLSHYLYYSRGLTELALVRLSFSNKCVYSVIQDFQIYRFSEEISLKSKSDERDYLNYVKHFTVATALDLSMCETARRLLKGLIHRNLTPTQLSDQFSTLSSVIEKVRKSYSDLMKIASKDPFVLEHYGSLMADIFQDKVGIGWVNQGKVERLRRAKLHINTIEQYSSEDMGVFVISCHPKTLGVICYANKQAAAALDCTECDMIGKALNDFLPPPYFIGHNEHLSNFLQRAEVRELLREHLFLYTSGKYSIEVTFRFRTTALKNVAYYLVAFRRKPRQRNFAVFNHEYIITSHSRYFKNGIMGRVDLPHPLNGRSLEAFFPGIVNKLTEYGFSTPILYTHPDTQRSIGLYFMSTSLGHDTVTWVYFLNRNSAIDDLFSTVIPGQASNFRRLISSAAFWSSEFKQTKQTDTPERNSAIELMNDIHKKEKIVKKLKDESKTGTTHCDSREKARIFLKKKISFHAGLCRAWLIRTMFLSVLLLVIVLAVSFKTLQTISQDSTMGNLKLTRLHLAEVIFLSRKLDLVLQGTESGESIQIALVLKDEIRLFRTGVNVQLIAEVPMWSVIDRRYEVLVERLDTAVADFLTHANLYADFLSPDPDNADLYYVFANGLGKFSQTFDSAISQYCKNRVSEVRDAVLKISVILLAVLCVGTCIGTALSIRHLSALSVCHRKCWDRIVNLRRIEIDEMISLFQDRMKNTLGKEEKLEQDSEFSIPEKGKELKMPSRGALLISSFLLLLAGTATFTILLLRYEDSQLETVLSRNEDLLNAVSIGAAIPTTVLTLLNEVVLEHLGVKSYHNMVESADVLYSLANRIDGKIAELAEIQRKVFIRGTDNSSGNQDFQDSLILEFDDSCTFLSIENCQISAISRGLHSSLSDFRMEISSVLETLPTFDLFHLLSLENKVSILTESVLKSVDQFQRYAQACVQDFWNVLLLCCVVYIVGCIGLQIAFCHPLINRLEQDSLALWRVTTMIRSEFLGEESDFDL